ncbi:predicted protein [Sclerotinia sclerotiorum 1980 UF-70]|uniref:Uncharacterized protein n=1 Tax=Sclerotinia sclerotiorum (strain ATCC 18683 / 1980 / Ss-1) TaxID=665079 RepID=A7E576_SCLS1|nr:predicted protein [Sclerotinia sclerotiorum 1980 UF-70]EDN91048.1 predicted protein [Sclerotinia sclerotiorum 1980 UF-70]
MAPQGHTATSETVDHLRVLCLVDFVHDVTADANADMD